MSKNCYIFPDFIIIGANKAGTTSVANYLNISKEIKISKIKEPMFFTSIYTEKNSIDKSSATLANPYKVLSLKEYSKLFESSDSNIRLYGEASTSYLANPKTAAPLIRSIISDVKLIAILREPIDRALSAYKMTFGNGMEKRSFDQIIEDFYKMNKNLKIRDRQGVKHYIENGFYYQLLEVYYKYFPEKNILLLKYDELVNNPKLFMKKIFDFLCVTPYEIDFSKKYNTYERHLKGKKIIISDSIKRRLAEIFYKEIQKLSKYINVDDWLNYYNNLLAMKEYNE